MIGLPFNDHRCLGNITEVVADLVAQGDAVLAQIAAEHATTEDLAAWIRSLPQRDDLGARGDGPKVAACEPPQRLRLPAPDPNCLERTALYVAVAEMIDPVPVRQMATLDTPVGLHTFPVENGAPVILDPRVPPECLDCGVAAVKAGPAAVSPRAAMEWTAHLAEAGAAPVRNGPSRVRQARNAMRALVDQGAAPDGAEVDSIGWMLAHAERAAKRYGARAVAIVRSTAQAVADLADEAIARAAQAQRNAGLALQIGHTRIEPAPWAAGLARIAARVGVDVGTSVVRSQLVRLGIDDSMLGWVEQELNREGLSLGPLAKAAPTKPASAASAAISKPFTFANVASRRTA